MTRITKERMIGVLGPAPRPKTVWEKQFDYGDVQLQELARRDWDDVPDKALWFYLHDLSYVHLQPDLFRYLFPACLKFWYDTLMRHEGASQGDAELHYALLHGDIMTKMMTEPERKRLLSFFVDGFIDRTDRDRGFDYVRPGIVWNAWIGRFNTLGIVAPIIPEIWRTWWSLDTPGRCVSAIKYASGLVYFSGENPIYQPWTCKDGGGGPYLTESDAGIFDRGWLEANLAFLQQTLTSDYIAERVSAAAANLSDEPEGGMAREIAADAQARLDVIALRIEALLANLAKAKLSMDHWE